MLIECLINCDECGGCGTVDNIGMVQKRCESCKCKRRIVRFITISKNWFCDPVGITLSIFFLMLLIYCWHPNQITVGALIALFGTVFIALKYKLDQANYHKDLFEKRLVIFLKIDELLSEFFQNKYAAEAGWRLLSKELDVIYRRSYFLFSRKTYQFISKFRQALIYVSMNSNSDDPNTIKTIDQENSFLSKLLDGQNLSINFPELKIDNYGNEPY